MLFNCLQLFSACHTFSDSCDAVNKNFPSLSKQIASIAVPSFFVEKSTLGDFIPDDKIPSPVQESSERILQEQVREILSDLSPKERKILDAAGNVLQVTAYAWQAYWFLDGAWSETPSGTSWTDRASAPCAAARWNAG